MLFLSFYAVCAQKGDAETRFFSGSGIQQKGEVQTFSYAGKVRGGGGGGGGGGFPPLVANSDLPIRKILMRVVGLLTVMERVSQSIFFQSKGFTACKFKMKKRWQIQTYYIFYWNKRREFYQHLSHNCKWKLAFEKLITFPTSSLEDYTVSITEDYIALMPIPEID